MIGAAIPFREVCVIGPAIAGYILFNAENYQIMGLYTNKKSIGLGKKLVDKLKLG